MSTKHYNSNYLEDTGNFFKSLKEYSYHPFTALDAGHVVDLGCGTGIDVITMSKLLGAKVRVTGIDHDPVMLEKARTSAEGLSNTDFILSEVFPLNFEDNSLSGVRAERLFQHLPDPQKLANEISRVLKPGKSLVIVESDWSGLLFYNEHVAIEKKIIGYLTAKKVNNGFASRELTSYLKKASLKNISIEVFPFVLKSLKQANEYLWFDKILQEAKDFSIITDEEFKMFLNALTEAEEGGYFACSMNMVVATASK